MAGEMKFYKCAFGEKATTFYTFHSEDSDAFAIGDRVDVETARGTASVVVRELLAETPPFPTRPIIRKTLPKESAEAAA